MITPEQQQAIQGMMKQSGYTPPASPNSPPTPGDWHSQIKTYQPTTPTTESAGSGENNLFHGAGGSTSIGSDIANALTGSEQTFGKAISTIGSNAPQQASEINDKNNASQQLLLHAIHVEADPAKKQHMLDAYQKIWGNNQPVTAGDINPGFNLSPEQVIGSAAGTALDVVSAGKLPEGSSATVKAGTEAPGILKGALEGAKSGIKVAAPLGAAYGVTGSMQNNESAGNVALGGLKGAATGAVAGGVLGGVAGGISGGLTNKESKAAAAKDAFVKDLITPQMTARDLTTAIKTGKVTEGEGLLGARDITGAVPNFENVQKVVSEVPGISSKNTLLENANAIHDHIGTVARDLRSQIRAVQTQVGEDRGFFTPNEFKGYMDGVKATISENPTIVGNAEQTATKILDKFMSLVKENGYTPEGLLDARQALDSWMKAQKGASVFDPTTENAVSTALRGVRQGGNRFLASKVPGVPVQDLLDKQTALYDAIDAIAPKAAKEGATGFQQFVKAHPTLVKAAKYGLGAAGLGIVGREIIP